MLVRPVLNIKTRTAKSVADSAKKSGRVRTRRELEEIGQQWVNEVTRIVERELRDRSGPRHKKYTTHISNSFEYRIIEGPDNGFPMKLELTTKPGVNAKKIGALEYGVKREYEIRAKNTQYLRWGDKTGDLHKPFQESVTWKPTGRIQQGYGFMRRARDRVLARRRRK